jgi:hypothetical protein
MEWNDRQFWESDGLTHRWVPPAMAPAVFRWPLIRSIRARWYLFKRYGTLAPYERWVLYAIWRGWL